ncbi:unnamed protein product [Paramecium sonneborni]|uniref:Uncharacterized protein n=1 Tax=Paramecium sonneborni TaxID=65129 RepID=A0A8S1QBS1_9CILI|nr:unnamed protein product [Paramecium sonneborni]
MSFDRIRKSFKSFLGFNTSPQIEHSSHVSISIPQEYNSSNSQCIINNKFVQIEKKEQRINPYKRSIDRLNDYYKNIVKGTDFSKCPTIQYSNNQDEKPVIDHKINNPRWKREEFSQNCSSQSQRYNSNYEIPNPSFFQIPSKTTKNQAYDSQILSQSREKQASINFQKKQFLSYLEDKPIQFKEFNENPTIEEKKKKSSQISIRRAESISLDDLDNPIVDKGRQTIQKPENNKNQYDEDNLNTSESIIIKKQPISKFNKLNKQEPEYNPYIPLIETKPISPTSFQNKEEQLKLPNKQQSDKIIKIPDEQIKQVQLQPPSIQTNQEQSDMIKQDPIIQQKIEPQIQQPAIEVNPFTSNIENPLFNAPWLTNQQPIQNQNQSTFNLFQSQPLQNEFQPPFIQQQQQAVFPFQNQTQSQQQQNAFSNENNFFSQQVQPASNQFITNQMSQNFFNQPNQFQSQSPFQQNQSFQQSQQSYKNEIYGFNQQNNKTLNDISNNNNNNNNNNFLFQTNSLGGGSFSADDQNKPRTIDLFSAQPVQNSQSSIMNQSQAVNLFSLDQNTSAQQQTNKESDRYKNKFKQNTVKNYVGTKRLE